MKAMKLITFFVVVFLMIFASACTPESKPTPTSVVVVKESIATAPQSNNSPTNTPVLTEAPTESPTEATSQSTPAGFSLKGVAGLSPTFIVPDGWYFTTEMGLALVNNYFVTKEKNPAGNSWHFSTGLSVGVTSHPEEANVESAMNLIDLFAKKASTKKILSNSQTEKGDLVIYDLVIESEYKDTPQGSPDRNKTVYYINVFDQTAKILYAISFESPTSIWDEEWKNGQIMIEDFINHLSSNSGSTSQAGFTNTLANTIAIPVNINGFERPTGIPSAAKSKFLETTGGGLSAIVPSANSPWQERYSLDLNTIDKLPSGAVIEVDFENPQDPSTSIAVRLSPTSSGSIHVESPLLTGFKCQNYWVTVYIYPDIRQNSTLDSYVQWINSSADLSKVTSITDFQSGKTCN